MKIRFRRGKKDILSYSSRKLNVIDLLNFLHSRNITRYFAYSMHNDKGSILIGSFFNNQNEILNLINETKCDEMILVDEKIENGLVDDEIYTSFLENQTNLLLSISFNPFDDIRVNCLIHCSKYPI